MKAKNIRYSSSDGAAIDMNINHPTHGWIPFTARSDDVEQLGREMFALAVACEFGEIDAYVEPEQDPPIAEDMRAQRDALLAELDFVVSNPLRWSGFDDAQKAVLAAYRQALLDVPQQAAFPDRIDWPDTPAFIA